jgi:ATP-binding cassette subfamily C protein CydD
VFEILDGAAVVAAGPEAGSESAGAGPQTGGAVGADSGSLVLHSVSAGYEGRAVLESLSAEFQPSRITAVIGPSGAGKSTLISLLLGFLPHTGRVELAGRSLRQSATGDDRLAWAGQRPGLLSGTVFENVALGSDAPSRALAQRALGLAAAHELDLDVELGVGGAGLSGGQAQRVAIARAIYRVLERGSLVLVLDEPSSALDTQTELRLLEGLRGLAQTERLIVIVVSHRTAVIDAADDVLAIAPLVAVA